VQWHSSVEDLYRLSVQQRGSYWRQLAASEACSKLRVASEVPTAACGESQPTLPPSSGSKNKPYQEMDRLDGAAVNQPVG
jgi:hypothetical protein